MKQKVIYFSALIALLCFTQSVKAYDFSAVVPSGQTLYFVIVNNTAQITSQNSSYPYYSSYPTGILTIPDSITNPNNGIKYSVTSIGDYAFSDCNSISSISIPTSITSIGHGAFSFCGGLTSVTIPNSVTNIGEHAFEGSKNLTTVFLPNLISRIENFTFNGCNELKNITIPNSVSFIGSFAFAACNSLSVTIPSSIDMIGTSAFYYVRHIDYHGAITGAPWGACSMNGFIEDDFVYSDSTKTKLEGYIGSAEDIIIPLTVDSIGDKAFGLYTKLISIVFPNSLVYIGKYAFSYCLNIDSITIPTSVNRIDQYAFAHCDSLEIVNVGDSVTSIGSYAFSYCNNLVFVNMKPHVAPSVGEYSFYENAPNRIFNIPCGCYSSYYTNSFWRDYRNFYHTALNELTVDYVLTATTSDSIKGTSFIIQQNGRDVACDSSAIIHAISNPGYRFVSWNNGNTANPDTLFLTCDSIVTAIFTEIVAPKICMVSVQDDGHNIVMWDKEHEVIEYNIYRESSVANKFDLVAVVPYDSFSAWIDSTSRPSTRSYRYRMTATDIYGYESASSTIHKTMHLTINQSSGNHWNLVWSGYSGASYSTYVIYRGTSISNLQQIDVIPSGGNTTYTDDNAPEGDIYYQVGVLMTTPCNPTKTYTICRSNIATNGSMESVGTIDDVENVKITSMPRKVIVNCLSGMSLQVIDMIGRTLYRNSNVSGETAIPIPTAGVYMIKVGNYLAKKVVVMN